MRSKTKLMIFLLTAGTLGLLALLTLARTGAPDHTARLVSACFMMSSIAFVVVAFLPSWKSGRCSKSST